MHNRKDCLVHLPDDIEYTAPDGVFMKGMLIERTGTDVHQHAHTYGHTSVLVRGRVRVLIAGMIGDTGVDYSAPAFIWIPAKVKHRFTSLEDNTHIYCIHNGTPDIHEENTGGF